METCSSTYRTCLFFQDGQIDYNEFVAMMKKGNADFDKKGVHTNALSVGFREALSVC